MLTEPGKPKHNLLLTLYATAQSWGYNVSTWCFCKPQICKRSSFVPDVAYHGHIRWLLVDLQIWAQREGGCMMSHKVSKRWRLYKSVGIFLAIFRWSNLVFFGRKVGFFPTLLWLPSFAREVDHQLILWLQIPPFFSQWSQSFSRPNQNRYFKPNNDDFRTLTKLFWCLNLTEHEHSKMEPLEDAAWRRVKFQNNKCIISTYWFGNYCALTFHLFDPRAPQFRDTEQFGCKPTDSWSLCFLSLNLQSVSIFPHTTHLSLA